MHHRFRAPAIAVFVAAGLACAAETSSEAGESIATATPVGGDDGGGTHDVGRFVGLPDYVLLDDRASQSSKDSYPLREELIDVYDVVGKPGDYKAVVYLRPHFQLDELTASIRLVAELPPPAAA